MLVPAPQACDAHLCCGDHSPPRKRDYSPQGTTCDRSASEEVDHPVADEEELADLGGLRVVGRAEVRHEVIALCEAAAVEVTGVRRTVDRHGAGQEVVVAPPEVVEPLVLLGLYRHDRLDGRRGRHGVRGKARPRRAGSEGEEQDRRMASHTTRVGAEPASHKPRLTLPDDSSRSGPSER